MEFQIIKTVPIFKVGTHNGIKFKEGHLQEMVENFLSLKQENPDFKIPIKLGHDKDGEAEKPAIGWMENLKLHDGFIFADFTDISEEMLEMLRKKSFKNRSIEVIRKFVNSKGKMIGSVIKGIALLGGSFPAVNLPDINFHKVPESLLSFGQEFDIEIIDLRNPDDFEDEDDDEQEVPDFQNSDIQTVIFNKERFKTKEQGMSWLAENGLDPRSPVDETDASFRSRQRPPGDFEEGSFRTVELREGITAVIGRPQIQKGSFEANQEVLTMSEEATKTECNEVKKEEFKAQSATPEPQVDTEREKISEVVAMENDSEFELFKEFKASFKDYGKVDEFLSSLKSQKEEYDAKIQEFKQKEADTYASSQKSFIETLIKEDKITPAEKRCVEAVLFSIDREQQIEFSVNEFETNKKTAVTEIFKSFLSNLPTRGNLGHEGSANFHSNWDTCLETWVKTNKSTTVDKLRSDEFAEAVAGCRKSSSHAEKLYLATNK